MSRNKKKPGALPVQEKLIDIRKFEPDQMRKFKIILIIGPQYSGKSWLLKDLLYYVNPTFPILIDPNEFATGFYGGILPKQCKKEILDNDWLEKFCGRQRQLLEFNKNRSKEGKSGLDISAGLVVDHSMADLVDLKWDKNPHCKFLFRSGKQASTTLIITSPYPPKMPAHYLASVDYVFLLKETSKVHKRKLFNMFGGAFGLFENFEEIFDQCTVDYRAMVIDRTRRGGDINEQIFWYKATSRPRRYRIGSPRLWKICYNTSITLDDLLTKPLMLYESRKRSRRHRQSGAGRPYGPPPPQGPQGYWT